MGLQCFLKLGVGFAEFFLLVQIETGRARFRANRHQQQNARGHCYCFSPCAAVTTVRRGFLRSLINIAALSARIAAPNGHS